RLLRRFERTGLALSVLPIGVFALVIWFVAIVSPQPELRFNEALFVFMPTDLILPFLRPAARRGYSRARVAFLALLSLLLALGVLVQPLWLPILIVMIPNLAAAL